MTQPIDSEFWRDDFWTDRRLLALIVGVIAFLGLMVVTFLYACLQMPGSVQPCAVGEVGTPPPAPCPPPRPLTPQWLAEQAPPPASETAPPEPCPAVCADACPETCPATEVALSCPCIAACTCQDETLEPCPCSERALPPPPCKPSKHGRARGRLFRRRCH